MDTTMNRLPGQFDMYAPYMKNSTKIYWLSENEFVKAINMSTIRSV